MSWRTRMNDTLWRRLGKPLFVRDAFQFQIFLCGTQGLWPELFRSASNNVVASYERYSNRRRGRREAAAPPDGHAVSESVRRGSRWLEGLQDERGIIEWGARWNLWDTANAVLGLQKAGGSPSVIEKSLSLLFSYQSGEGGVPNQVGHYGRSYCIETTSMSMLAEYFQKGRVTDEVSRGVGFILGRQHPVGGWETPYLGISPEEVQVRVNYYPSNTGFALAPVLLFAGRRLSDEALAKALAFLAATQRRDGIWGTALSYCSVEGYATRNTLPALRLVAKRTGPLAGIAGRMVASAEGFARRSQNPDGSWPSRGPSSKELATALMGRSLPMDRGDPTILRAVGWLLGRQRGDGRWSGGSLGGESLDVLATAEAVSLLAEYENGWDVLSAPKVQA